jgi:uncharacterized protein
VKHILIRRALMTAAALCATTVSALASGSSGSGSVSIPSVAGVTQNFNTLSNSTSPSNALPTGWYLTELGTGAAADGSYVVSTGSGNAGGAYSFGAASATDRALGSLGSGTVSPIYYGAQFTNNTGSVISAVTISYTGEMWRRGTATVANNERLFFTYSVDATNLTTGTFLTPPTSLDFVSPGDSCSATQNAATNGNDPNCRRAITATISGLTIADGQTFWIRWQDSDTPGSDDGMSIDDVTITPTLSNISISPTATGSASPNPAAPGGSTTLSGTITPGQNPASVSFAVSCDLSAIGGSATQALPVTGTTFSFAASVGASVLPGSYSFSCSVIDDQARSTNFSIALTVLIPLNSTCGAPATPIDSVQGPGATSPLVGQVVDVEGIVVGDFQGSSALNGFFLEEPVATQDGNPLTSEGIFVFASSLAVNSGDRVRIRGTVTEFASGTSSATELGSTSNATVCSTGNPLPPAVTITLPLDPGTTFERYEGMLVQFTQQLVVTGSFSLGQFGQIDLAPAVLFTPTNTPGNVTTWAAATDLNARSVVSLDDASNSANANLNGGGLAPYPAPGLSASNTLRVGALVNPDPLGGSTPVPLVGILDEGFSVYRIQPIAPVTFSNAPNPRPDTAAQTTALGGRFRVASANVLNFFTTLGKRGAQTAQELINQRAKVVAELSKLNSDIYGLSEVQNFANGNTSGGTYTNDALNDLATNLATATGRNYQFINTIVAANVVGGDITQNGTDAIRSAIIYDASTVTPVGLAALYYQFDTNRPSLAQTFKPAAGAKADSQTFTVVVNHFRSKGSACGGASDDPFQGNCNGLRLNMAQNVQTWLAGNPTSDPAPSRKLLLVGDYNAYLGEDPIQSFLSNGYTNLIAQLIGPGAYSYNFGSRAGYLDHGIVNAALLPLIKNVAELHINADEPAALEALGSDQKSATAQAAYFAANEFAASDHDPFVVALNPLAGDLDDDGIVGVSDRNLIVANYNKPASQVDRRMDYDGDGRITPNDYRIWVGYYSAFIR